MPSGVMQAIDVWLNSNIDIDKHSDKSLKHFTFRAFLLKSRIVKRIFIAVLALAAAAACERADLPLENTQWKLVELDGDANPAFADENTFVFSLDGESITGVGACNRFFGGYELSQPNGFELGMMGMTRMACPNMELEDAFVRMLDEADSYTINGDVLMLLSGGKKRAEFKGAAMPAHDESDMPSEEQQ